MAKILLVEDNEQNRDMLARRLQRKGHQVVTAADGERAVAMAGSESPDLILMDLNLPVLDGWMATRRIKDCESTRAIPVIALTAHAMAGDRQKALGAGCDDYDTKPVELDRLLGKIAALLKTTGPVMAEVAPPAVPARVPVPAAAPVTSTAPAAALPPRGDSPVTGRLLVVDDNPANRDMLRRRLARHGFDVDAAPEGAAALRMLDERPFDLVLLDVMMPGMNGLDVLRVIRQTRAPTQLPVIMATARDASQDVVEALELGASDYVTKPLDFPVVLARVRTQLSLKHSVEQIRELERGLEQRNAELQAANAKMRDDLDAAAKVQAAMLPAAEPRVAGYRFAWRFVPSAWLAGDILNVFPLDERHVALYLLDVSGHGVAAALLSVTVSRFLSPARDPASLLWRRDEGSGCYVLQPPEKVAARLCERFPFEETAGQFFTLVYGLLDLQTHRLRYVSAGHPGLVHVPRGGHARIVDASGFPIGVTDEPYDEYEVHLAPGDRVYLYSDGVPEAPDEADNPYGAERLLAHLDGTRDHALDPGHTSLLASIDLWRARRPLNDDVSVLALQRADDPPRP
jgi:sigma-B regulation protein RsbU (phosphoserine phosphatase)